MRKRPNTDILKLTLSSENKINFSQNFPPRYLWLKWSLWHLKLQCPALVLYVAAVFPSLILKHYWHDGSQSGNNWIISLPAITPSLCLFSRRWGMDRDKTRTRPEFVPTHRVGLVDMVFSEKPIWYCDRIKLFLPINVDEKWRHLTKLPSSAMTLLSGRQESGTSFSGIRGVVSENWRRFFSWTLAVWLRLRNIIN